MQELTQKEVGKLLDVNSFKTLINEGKKLRKAYESKTSELTGIKKNLCKLTLEALNKFGCPKKFFAEQVGIKLTTLSTWLTEFQLNFDSVIELKPNEVLNRGAINRAVKDVVKLAPKERTPSKVRAAYKKHNTMSKDDRMILDYKSGLRRARDFMCHEISLVNMNPSDLSECYIYATELVFALTPFYNEKKDVEHARH